MAGIDLAGAFGGAAKGVAAGALLGPPGMAVGGLVGLGMSLAPELGKWLGGAAGEQTARDVAEVVAAAAGTGDPDVAANALAEKPERALELRVQLAQIAAAREAEVRRLEVEEIKAHVANQQDARAKEIALARDKSPLAYGAAVVTLFLMGLFAWVTVMSPPLDEGLSETLKTMTIAAVFYWVGSSRGSAAKDGAARSLDGGAK